MKQILAMTTALFAFALSACSGVTGGAPTNAAIAISLPNGASSLALIGIGSSAAIGVNESGYIGQFRLTSTNAKVATVTPSTIQASAVARNPLQVHSGTGSFTVTAIGDGATTIWVSDWFGDRAQFAVTVSTPSPVPTPIPTPVPTPGAVALTPSALTFTATGAAYALSTTASQSQFSGSFSASTATCSGIATISPSSGTTFTVTPVAAGSCTFTIAGANGISATLSVGVTTTTVGGS